MGKIDILIELLIRKKIITQEEWDIDSDLYKEETDDN